MAEEIRIPLDGTYLPITKFGSGKKNLVILPGQWAADFEEFCRLNPFPCAVLDGLYLLSD